MKFRLNSLEILKKWRVRKQLFQIDNKLYVEANSMDSKDQIATLIIMGYEEQIEQPLQKIIKKCNKKATETSNRKLIIPTKMEVDVVENLKMHIFELKERPISLHHLMTQCKYHFTVKELLEAAISGISCLAELHSMGITHQRISPQTCYFYNRLQVAPLRKTNKTELITSFGLNIIDAAKYESKKTLKESIDHVLYQPISNALNIKYSCKSDLESLVYVLIKMGTGDLIFSQTRYKQEWVTEENVKKWKIKSFFSQICEIIPQDLSFLIELYLFIQQINFNEQPEYQLLFKKLWSWKSNNANKQTELNQLNGKSIYESNIHESLIHIADSSQLIFEEDIQLNIRHARKGIQKVNL